MAGPSAIIDEIRVDDCLAVERAVLCVVSGCPRAKAIFAADEERQIFLELAFVRREKNDQPAEMIVMTVAQDERIEGRWVDLENGHVVE